MEEFGYFGAHRLKEHARKADQFNRQAWMFETVEPKQQPRQRIWFLRGR